MRFATLDDWLRWQEGLHPKAIDLGLDRVAEVWKRLRPGGLTCPVLTVAGTNGKGSCVAMAEAMARAGGYRTGAYTSPHLRRYNERIRIDGAPIADAPLCASFDRIDQARGDLSLTYFEFGTLAALDLFAVAEPDLVVLEVGLGGRLDAVNLIDADVGLVSAIGLDHADWLGSDLDGIAREKAGIFRAGRPAIIGQADAPAALREAAQALGATVYQAQQEFAVRRVEGGWDWLGPRRNRSGLPVPALRSARQLDNAAAVLMALECLGDRLPLGQDAVREGLLEVRLEGRMQRLPGAVPVILDVAHNPQAASNLAQDLRAMPHAGRTHCVFACLKDKDAAGILTLLAPLVDTWYFAGLHGARARPPAELGAALAGSGADSPAAFYLDVAGALAAARAAARSGDRIVVTGSFLTVADALAVLAPAA